MNVLYLLKVLGTNKLSELIAAMDMSPLDMNLAIWGAVDAGEIEIDEDKDRIQSLKNADSWHDPALAIKLVRVIQHYAASQLNISRGRLQTYIKDPMTNTGYPLHEYLMTLQYLIDNGTIVEEVITVPEVKKKRPFRRWVFLCLPENSKFNEEWNAREVNKWIANWDNKKVK